MAISGNLPKHLEVAARTGILASPPRDDMPYRRVAMEVDLTAATQQLVDLGGMPLPTNDPKVVDTLIEKTKAVTPQDWYLTLHISQNAIDDDQTGRLESNFKNIVPAFQRHINSRVFTVLNSADGVTESTGLDGLALFDANHKYAGAQYATVQDNEYALALSLDNFNTVWVAARAFVDDQGNYFNYNYNLLVVHPTSNVIAYNITGNPEAMDTANRERNPYATGLSYITSPYLDTTAWMLIAESEPTKPLVVAIRKRPALLNMWFDSQQPDGGYHYFQYHGRYVVEVGDWPLAIMGNT